MCALCCMLCVCYGMLLLHNSLCGMLCACDMLCVGYGKLLMHNSLCGMLCACEAERVRVRFRQVHELKSKFSEPMSKEEEEVKQMITSWM